MEVLEIEVNRDNFMEQSLCEVKECILYKNHTQAFTDVTQKFYNETTQIIFDRGLTFFVNNKEVIIISDVDENRPNNLCDSRKLREFYFPKDYVKNCVEEHPDLKSIVSIIPYHDIKLLSDADILPF